MTVSSPVMAVQYAGFCRQALEAESRLCSNRPLDGSAPYIIEDGPLTQAQTETRSSGVHLFMLAILQWTPALEPSGSCILTTSSSR